MKTMLTGIRLKKSAAYKDLIAIILIGVPLLAFASIFHMFERFAKFHQRYGVGPIDDLIIVFSLLAIAFAIFSLRRWRELQRALGNVKTLQGLIPLCASCREIRDDVGYWNHLEFYIETHTEAELVHTICPKCLQKLYGAPRSAEGRFSTSVFEGIGK